MPTGQAVIGVFYNPANQDVLQVINSQGALVTVLSSSGAFGTTPTAQSLMGRYQNPFNQDLIQAIDQNGNITVILNAFGNSGGTPTEQAIIGRFDNSQGLDLIQTVNQGGRVITILGNGVGISNLVFQVTDTTIVATWNTAVPSLSNLFANGKAAIDNGVAAPSTSHQAIVTGLLASALYSCYVQSGSATSGPTQVQTNVSQTRLAITSVSFGSPTATANDGDIVTNFLSNDNNTYMTRDDATTPGTAANQQIDKITNESTLAISQVNAMTAYGGFDTSNGTDGPGGVALSNKLNGLFGMGGSLYAFCGRHYISGDSTIHQQFYGNVIQSNDHGATWNNFLAPSTFDANGNPPYPPSPAPYFFGNNSNFGWVTPVRYAADDGTLGYNTAGNQVDGANGWVYFTIINGNNDSSNFIYLGRIPRIQLAALNYLACEFWIGPTSPTPSDFVSDSNWQASATGLTEIYANTGKCGWPDIVFVPTINRYVMNLSYRPNVTLSSNSVWLVLEAPTPAGPWTQVGTQTNNPSGYYGQNVLHRTACTNMLTNNIPLTLIYSGDYNNPTYYHPTYSSLTLVT